MEEIGLREDMIMGARRRIDAETRKQIIDRAHTGESYYSIGHSLGISHFVVKYWASKGGVEYRKNGRARILASGDGRVHSVDEWARMTGIPRQKIFNRLKAGWTTEEALGFVERPVQSKRSHLITSSGESASISEWADKTGINRHTIRFRLKSGWTVEQALGFDVPPRKLEYDGRSYTLEKAGEVLGLSRGAVAYRVKAGWTPERIFTTRKKAGAAPNPTPVHPEIEEPIPPAGPGSELVTVSSGECASIIEWSNRTGTPLASIKYRIKSGWSPDEAVGLVKRDLIAISSGEAATLDEWSRRTGTNPGTIQKRLKSGWTPDQALGFACPPGKLEYDGRFYSASDVVRLFGVTPNVLRAKILDGWTVEQIISNPKPRRGRPPKPRTESREDVVKTFSRRDGQRSFGAASKVRRIDPVTGKVIAEDVN